MTGKRTRLIALLLAASLFVNTMIFPAQATESAEQPTQADVAPTEAPSPTEAPPAPAETEAPPVTEAPTAAPEETQAPTEPTEETKAPTEPTEEVPTEETEVPTEPTEETEETEPELDEAAIRAAQEEGYRQAMEYYRAMPVSGSQDMPLEWWYAVTGKAAMREPDLSVLTSGEGMPAKEENGDWSAYVVFPEWISVQSARELILLSYVRPANYEKRTITLAAGAGPEFDLTRSVVLNEGSEYQQELHYQGLGSLDAPFSGTLRYGEQSEAIYFVLRTPLFKGLYCSARFVDKDNAPISISLVSKAASSFDGLLAQHILGETGMEANWALKVSAPDAADGTNYCLPSLLGVMYGYASVNLELTDNSELSPSPRGYLCATMYGSAVLNVANVTRSTAAPMVGEISADATLLINGQDASAPAEEPTEEATETPTEEATEAPTEGATEAPTEEATEAPTEEPTEDVMSEAAYLARLEMAISFYRSMEVIPGEMPLEWWYVVTDQVTAHSVIADIVMNGVDFLRFLAESEAATAPSLPAEAAAETEPDENNALPEDTITPAEAILGDTDGQAAAYAADGIALLDFDFNADTLTINSSDDLIRLSHVDAQNYQDKTLHFVFNQGNPECDTTGSVSQGTGLLTYNGLGSDAAPFSGTVTLADASKGLTFVIGSHLFTAISSKAVLSDNLKLKSAAADEDGLLAQYVYGDGEAAWAVTVADGSTTLPAILGTMKTGAKVTLTVANPSGIVVTGRGYLCGTMEANAELTFDTSAEGLPVISSAKDGNVGGLVGTMNSGALLHVSSAGDITVDVTASAATYAGGLVGRMDSGATLDFDAAKVTVKNVSATSGSDNVSAGGLVGCINSATILAENLAEIVAASIDSTFLAGGIAGDAINPILVFSESAVISGGSITSNGGKKGAVGGMYGKLTWSNANNLVTLIPVKDVTFTSSNDCGGLFGFLRNSGSLTISGENLVTGVTFNGNSSSGGLIGWYPTTGDATLVIQGVTLSSTITSGNNFGGLIGYAEMLGSSSSIQVSGSTVTYQGTAPTGYSAGLIAVMDKKTFLEVNSTTINCKATATNYGGLVGNMQGADSGSGSLVLVGKDVKITNAPPGSGTVGGLIGNMDSGVLYMASTPALNMESIGGNNATRGWIVGRRGDNTLVCSADPDWEAHTDQSTNDTGRWGQVLRLASFAPGLVSLDADTHVVTVRKPAGSNGSYQIGSLDEFAALALRLQLDSKGYLQIDDDITAGSKVAIQFTNHVALGNSGLTGFVQDISSAPRFSYEITGNGNTVTLPTISPVHTAGDSHDRQGLIAVGNKLTATDLTVDGGYTLNRLDQSRLDCGICATVCDEVAMEGVTSKIRWVISRTPGYNDNISGVIGCEENWNNLLKMSFTNCTLSCDISFTDVNDYVPFRMGGLVGSMDSVELTISGLTVKETNLSTKSNDQSQICGGLLGCSWLNTIAVISDVTVSHSSLRTDSRFGGLVYYGSGYWKVNSDGITISNTKFTGYTTQESPSAIIVAKGFDDNNNSALYLELLEDAFKLDGNSVTVQLSGDRYFDELVGKTENGENNENSAIVSIATSGHAGIDANGECNTYRHQLNEDYDNPNTRYYYNLDLFREHNPTSGTINSPERMVLWSAWRHCHNDLKQYFLRWDNRIMTGDLDLTGYSFYPATYDGTRIHDAAITFACEQLDNMEEAAKNKRPLDSQRQHAQMHTGIFTTANGEGTLSVSNLTLSGTVGKYGSNSGAIIRDGTGGVNVTQVRTLSIQGVTLNGIRIYPTVKDKEAEEIRPLLIESISGFTTMTMRGVKVAENAPYKNADGSVAKAASSLIGNVGDANAQYIQLVFEDMLLQEDRAKNSQCHLFTHAMFLESFQYSDDTCQGVYNFAEDEDYTLGQELSNTDGSTPSGRNNGMQYWFFGQYGKEGGEVYKVIEGAADPAAAFGSFPRYVCKTENNDSIHELDINLPSYDLITGCGTYSHPYIISNAAQLETLAAVINSTNFTQNGWKVKVDTAAYAAKRLNAQDVHTGLDTDGTTACGAAETLYTSSTAKWSGSDGSTAEGTDIVNYLCNAYYQLSDDIAFSETWTGLGKISRTFQGVIDGKGHKVTVKTGKPAGATQFGGLIKFSTGSVVRSITVSFTETPGVLGNTHDVCFGGVVARCLKGDTVLENVKVTFANAPTSGGVLAPVGGMVGLLGGADGSDGGGVIFRGSCTVTGFDQSGFYRNRYIGRVLDGYALSDGDEVDNGENDYQIPQITDGTGLSVNGTNATVTSGNGLWALSAIVNSGAGFSDNAYNIGKGRAADYSQIGTKNVQLGDEIGFTGSSGSFITAKFNVSGVFRNLSSFSLTIGNDIDMSGFGSGFRGIGGGYDRRIPTLIALNGGGHTVTLGQTWKEYASEPNGARGTAWTRVGGGLFSAFTAAAGTSVSDLNLAGSIAVVCYADNGTSESRPGIGGIHLSWRNEIARSYTATGMLAGYVKGAGKVSLSISDVHLQNVAVNSGHTAPADFAGGLIGRTEFDTGCTLRVSNCTYTRPQITARANAGGLFGYINNAAATISNVTCTNGVICNTYGGYESLSGISWDGIGGLIGMSDNAHLQIEKVQLETLTLTFSFANGSNDSCCGGLVGAWRQRNGTKGGAKDITLKGTVIMSGSGRVNTGAISGFITNNNLTNWDGNGGESDISLQGIQIAAEDNSSVRIVHSNGQSGGLVGVYKNSHGSVYGNLNITDVTIGHEVDSGYAVSITGGSDGAALVGNVCSQPWVVMSNIVIRGTSIQSNEHAALLFARKCNNGVSQFDIYDVEAIGCSVSGKATVGFVYGDLFGGTANIRSKNIRIENSMLSGNGRKGVWGGSKNSGNKGGSGTVKLVAVTLKNCTTPDQDFGVVPSDDSYVVRANYTAVKDNTSGSSPYVPVNPTSPLTIAQGTGYKTFTGDGAAFYEGTIPMGTAIVNETAESPNRYYNVNTEKAYFITNSGYISTYNAAGNNKTALAQDFPVLVVPATDSATVTKEIYSYISLLTNQSGLTPAVLKNQVISITATTYLQADGGFSSRNFATNSTLTIASDYSMQAAKGEYDNENDRFTLLEIVFKDPTATNTNEGAYTLYIPLIIQRVLEFRFWAAAMDGTNYYLSAYDDLSTISIGSHGQPTTVLFGFDYLRSIEEWQNAVDTGENLLWYFEKPITVTSQGAALPAGTKLTLVDRNNQDKAFFREGTLSDALRIESFFGQTEAEHGLLCDGLGLEATEAADGGFVTTDAADSAATLRIGEQYYRPATAADAQKPHYSIKVGKQLQERYYLTIQTPADTDGIVNLVYSCQDRLEPRRSTGIPTERVRNVDKNGNTTGNFARNGAENQMLLGNFFSQTVTVVTGTENTVMSTQNNAISATLTAEIKFANAQAADLFKQYGAGKKLFQRFDLYLRRYDAASPSGQDTAFAEETTLDVTYKLNDEEKRTSSKILTGGTTEGLIFSSDGIDVSSLGDSTTLTLTAEITLTYTEAGITEQFPIRTKATDSYGVLVCANSYLAYSSPALAQSNSPQKATDAANRYYYREEYGATTLTYSAIGSTPRSMRNQLGINDLDLKNTNVISSIGMYNVSALNAATQAATLTCTITLECKDNSGKYVSVSNPDSLLSAKIGATLYDTGSQEHFFAEVSGRSASFDLRTFTLNKSIPIQIPVTLTVTTGDDLEKLGASYANYRVTLTASLSDSNGQIIAQSTASDFIIYTNANIITTLIRIN